MALGRVLVLLVLALLGIALAGHGWTAYQNQKADVKHAVTVEGTVESTDVEYTEGSSSANSPSSGHYDVIVRYTYTYQGQSYTSKSVYPGAEKQISTEDEAMSVVGQFPPGETTTVYVNREDPSRSFLIKEKTHFGLFIFMGIGALLALSGIAGVGKEIVRGVSGD